MHGKSTNRKTWFWQVSMTGLSYENPMKFWIFAMRSNRLCLFPFTTVVTDFCNSSFYGVMTTHYHSFNSVIYTYFHEGFILPPPSVSALIKPLHRSFHGTKIDDLKYHHVYESQITNRGTWSERIGESRQMLRCSSAFQRVASLMFMAPKLKPQRLHKSM